MDTVEHLRGGGALPERCGCQCHGHALQREWCVMWPARSLTSPQPRHRTRKTIQHVQTSVLRAAARPGGRGGRPSGPRFRDRVRPRDRAPWRCPVRRCRPGCRCRAPVPRRGTAGWTSHRVPSGLCTRWRIDCAAVPPRARPAAGRSPPRALGILGNKWTMLVIFAPGPGVHRFSELRDRIAVITRKVLTLRALERDGLAERTVYPVVPPEVEYRFTELGRSLLESLTAVREWARRTPTRC
ncbi:transcriptional regulator [Streptomyces sp. me109]|uniref:winged helix-turn-helix transcriptional regulator n=1 Tax=Streptomyces sp. me109 TaxID=1827853 RepID=UPI0011CDFA2E|nr:helix-turn-helix domain-containing protein [Streptomyces sp. me109]TXS69680.1 transcriptional regulator [Streptomyces sp. me109]